VKAIVYTEYGAPEVLHVKEIEKPTPKDNEVLVKVHATTVTIGDSIMRSFNLPVSGLEKVFARLFLGINKPKRPILGMELAGTIEAIGKAVTRLKVGDAVMGSTFAANFGGYAEYKCLPERGILTSKPTNLTFEEAAAVSGGGMTALRCFKKANIQRGQKVLIYGASGSVGTYAVQIAKHFGAKVTGICSTMNLDLVRSLGVDKVIDYTREDFTASGETYDLVFDAVHKLAPDQRKKALASGGIFLDIHSASNGSEKLEDLNYLKGLIEAGELRPVIDRCYSMDAIVEAHRYVDKGHKKGNVVITVI
jgi:NADPH:quinone reductase-like Zn-dependent oxidoreductase